ncbi:hypothetical protein JST56_02305 [Candidatus Dependentiae bacterium]|nr:hypothetical protein [Candidatus Dependentiae bacterium]
MFIPSIQYAHLVPPVAVQGEDQSNLRIHSGFYGVLLFAIVFIVFATAVDTIWFREDDLGTIINGIIRSWDDFIRVLSTDARDFICPVNYHRSKPNLISGFLRPLQHVLFTIEYYFFSDWAYGYYLVHVGLHACNAVLVYVIGLWALPVWLAFFSGLLFAFYPDVSWLTWIATAQNTLCTLFLLLTFIWWKRRWLAGLMFFFSLLARENVVALPVWFFLGALFFLPQVSESFWKRIVAAFKATWIFFAVDAVYWSMRWWAFGFGTLGRTFNNILLRFPFLANLVHKVEPYAHATAPGVQTRALSGSALQAPSSFFDSLVYGGIKILQLGRLWLSSVLMIDLSDPIILSIALVAFIFVSLLVLYAYREHLKIFLFLLIGIVLMSWPAAMAYPCPRYLNTIYPVIVLLMVGSCFLLYQKQATKKYAQFLLVILSFFMVKGIILNRAQLYDGAAIRAEYKKRFDQFFAQHAFVPQTRFVVFGSPFVSDIQSIFQTYLNDISVVVAHELMATLAEQGTFSCNGPYRARDVVSRLEPIDGGFRFISDDPQHCAWWIHFSDHPLMWSQEDYAYIWTAKNYQENIWYPCSLGKFKINKMLEGKYLTDVSFVFDQKWIDDKTVFISWDTRLGRYIVLDVKHLLS